MRESLQDAVKSISDYFLPGLSAGGRLVVVAHSQGNVIAQWLHLRAMSEVTHEAFSRLRVVNVANIMRTAPSGLDITSPRDVVVYELMAKLGWADSRYTSECPTPLAPVGNCPFKARAPTVFAPIGDNICPGIDSLHPRYPKSHYFAEEYLGAAYGIEESIDPACKYRPSQELAANASFWVTGGYDNGYATFTNYQPLRNRVVDAVYTALDAVEGANQKDIVPGFPLWQALQGVSVNEGEIALRQNGWQQTGLVSRQSYPGTNLKVTWSGCFGQTAVSYQMVSLNLNSRDSQVPVVPYNGAGFAGPLPTLGLMTRWEKPGILYLVRGKGDVDSLYFQSYFNDEQLEPVVGAVATAQGFCGDFVMGVAASKIDGKRRGYFSFTQNGDTKGAIFVKSEIEIPAGSIRVQAVGFDGGLTFRNLNLDTSCAPAGPAATACYLNTPRDQP